MNSKQELSIKLVKSIEQQRALSKLVKKQAQRIRELESSRALWKSKSGCKSLIINQLRRDVQGGERRPARHRYPLSLIGLCLNLRLVAGASYRSIVRILLVMQLGGYLKKGSVPCANSMENWTKKLGCQALKVAVGDSLGERIGVIVDESMGVGPYKQLLVLGVDAQKAGEGALRFEQVRVLGVWVEKSFTGERISELLTKVSERTGKQVAYGVSDDDSKLKKAFGLLRIPRVSDASHAMGRCLEQVFKGDAAYEAFSKAASEWIFKGINRDYAYLLPPKQRVMARFMNIAPLVKWAKSVLSGFEGLPQSAKAAFANLKDHGVIIKELGLAIGLAGLVSEHLKSRGLSSQTIAHCLGLVGASPPKSPKGVVFKEKLIDYLNSMAELVKGTTSNWECSSEIIERMFGKQKSTKADNRLVQNGVNLLEMPLYCLSAEQVEAKICPALEGISLAQLNLWFKAQFPENQAHRRRLFFKKRK